MKKIWMRLLLRSDSRLSYPNSSLIYCSNSSHDVHISHGISGQDLMAVCLITDCVCASSPYLPKFKPSAFSLLAAPDQDSERIFCRQYCSASCTSLHQHPLPPPFTPAEVQKAGKNKVLFPEKPSKMREVASFYQIIISRCSELSKHKMCWTGLGIALLKSQKIAANPRGRNPWSSRESISFAALPWFSLALF